MKKKPDFINIEDKKFAFYTDGDKENEAVILLHGWPETSKIWEPVLPTLSQNYYTISIDLPGLGDSDEIENHDTGTVATLIEKIKQAFHIEQFHLLSHDIGSWVAFTYALLYEQNLKSLTLIDAGIPGILPESYFGITNAEKAWHFYFHSIDALPEMLIKGKEFEYFNWFFEHKSFIKTAITKADIQYYADKYKGKITAGFRYYRSYRQSSDLNKALLRKLKIPVLTIGGEYAVGDKMKAVADTLSDNGYSEVISDCGHFVPEEQPQNLLMILNKFLRAK